jgi:hypothetical protein
VSALPQVMALDRTAIRRRFEARFSATRMAKDYIQVYRSLLKSRLLPKHATIAPMLQPELEQEMH